MKGKFKKAVTYAVNQKEELSNYLLDGRLQISNNLVEASVKPVALGRKNFLFSDSYEGAEANSVCHTVVESAKANGLNPRKYLEFLLEKITNLGGYPDDEKIDSLLPWVEDVQLSCR